MVAMSNGKMNNFIRLNADGILSIVKFRVEGLGRTRVKSDDVGEDMDVGDERGGGEGKPLMAEKEEWRC
jgi:hypothetical protein